MIDRKLFARLAVFGLVAASAAVVLVAKDRGLTVKLHDDCDPTTFNAVLGPGACVGHGETTFKDFLAQVQEEGSAEDWEFTPDEGMVRAGSTVSVTNRGGETHTFTKVAHFGGGFIPLLNGKMVPRPECAQVDGTGNVIGPQPPSAENIFVPSGATVPGPTAGSADLPSGHITKFQCCIHPWMRIEIASR